MLKVENLRKVKDYNFIRPQNSVSSNIISSIPPEGLLINKPGKYVFTNNIQWNPASLINVALFIVAPNVTIDFNGFTLESSITDTLSTAILALDTRNICFENGNIFNMGLIGIICINTENVNFCNLVISRISAQNLAFPAIGILIANSRCININRITIKDIDVTAFTLSAILLIDTVYSNITYSDIHNLRNSAGVCAGLSYINCAKSNARYLNISRLETLTLANSFAPGHTCIGIVVFQSERIKCDKCCIKDITGSCDDAHGISFFVVRNGIIKNCHVENVIDGKDASAAAKATGIEIYGWTDISDNSLSRNSIRSPSNILVKNCHVKNIIALNPGDKQAAGFSVAGSCVKFVCCTAKNVAVYNGDFISDICTGLGYGFAWAPDIRDAFIYPAYEVIYDRCEASYCQVGFDTFYHINSKWDSVKSCENGVDILKLNHTRKVLFCNQCSECPDVPPGEFKYVPIDNIACNNSIRMVPCCDN